tara:strand:+ start:7208 stop:7510 length:303 start_codon:yes stop_codon:yes gene_type:complete
MVIKVSFDYVKYDEVINYYNLNKPNDWLPISKLNRIEGGFQIKLSDYSLAKGDVNNQIRQLRWDKKMLKPGFYNGLFLDEVELLYNSLVHVHGKESVEII